MKASIDSAGRVVIPKRLRDSLGIRPGVELEFSARDGHLEIAVPPTRVRLVAKGRGRVAVPESELPSLSTDLVRDTLESTRR